LLFSACCLYIDSQKSQDVVSDKMLAEEEKTLLLARFRDIEVPGLDFLSQQLDRDIVLRNKEKLYLINCTRVQKQRIVRGYFLGQFHKAPNTEWTGEIIVLPPAPEYVANSIVRGWKTTLKKIFSFKESTEKYQRIWVNKDELELFRGAVILSSNISILGICVSKGVSVGYIKLGDCWRPALEDICKEDPFSVKAYKPVDTERVFSESFNKVEEEDLHSLISV